MSNQLLDVKGLKVYYSGLKGLVKAVDDVSFQVGKKEICGIAGESGCGKSTLASALARLIVPPGYIEEGQIVFDGTDLLKLDEEQFREIRWKRISIVPQSAMNALNPVMKVSEQIADAITAHENVPDRDLNERIPELLKSVGLFPEVARMFPHELSGGMKQRAVIAMAIALRPDLVIADESTSALDVTIQRLILQTLMDLRRRLGFSLILIAHDMAVQAQTVDRLNVMYAGKIVETGSAIDLFKEPLHPYSKMLISSVPSLKAKKIFEAIPGLPPNLINPPSGCRFHPRCPHIMDICRIEEPKLCEVRRNGLVACHLFGDGIEQRI